MRSLLSLALVFAVACGGGAAEGTQNTTPTPSASAAPSAAPSASASTAATTTAPATGWSDDMSKDQKVAFMKANVVPKMGPVFQEKDKAKWAEVGCKTCHGPNHKAPKDFLPHLTMKDGKMTAFADKPEMAKFMMDKVTPAMAGALGEKPYDMQTHQGFGCGGCHAIDMK